MRKLFQIVTKWNSIRMINLENQPWASSGQEIKKRKKITRLAISTYCLPQISNKILKFDTNRKWDKLVFSKKLKNIIKLVLVTNVIWIYRLPSLTKSKNRDCNEAFPSLRNVLAGEMICSSRKKDFG